MLESFIILGFDETLKTLSGGKLNYETKLSSAGLIFWFYGQQVIAKILQLDSNKVKHQSIYIVLPYHLIVSLFWLRLLLVFLIL